MTNKTRILIECTHTYYTGGNSGIQRVVRNIANQSSEFNLKEVDIHPIIWTGFGFYQPKKKLTAIPPFFKRIKNAIVKLLRLDPNKKRNWLKKAITWLPKYIWAKLRLLSVYSVTQELPYMIMGLVYLPAKLFFGKFIHFRKGDIVVLVDSTWRSRVMIDALFKAQYDKGIQIGVMFHDLFPLQLPETCDEITIRGYIPWFNRIAPRADFFIANSEATRKSFDQHLQKHPELRPHHYKSGSFKLGAELDLAHVVSSSQEVTQPIWDTKGKAILSIGTIEPRKNHAFLLDAFDILRAKDADVSLILIGRKGWKNDDVLERIKSHPDYATRLLHFSNANDYDLFQAIERADCLVCPSIAEGFGLPVVEGLMHGLNVFASDIPSFREIGTGYCQFFSLDSPQNLANLLEKSFNETTNNSPKENTFTWPDWKQSAQEFIELTLTLSGHKTQKKTEQPSPLLEEV